MISRNCSKQYKSDKEENEIVDIRKQMRRNVTIEKHHGVKVAVFFLVIVFAVVFLSSLSNRLMGGKSEGMK